MIKISALIVSNMQQLTGKKSKKQQENLEMDSSYRERSNII